MVSQPAGSPWPTNNLLGIAPNPAATLHAYLHIPFCVTRCGYCDFNTYTASELPGVAKQDFHEVLAREIDWSQQVLTQNVMPQREISTVFIGGGTPSQLQPTQIGSLLQRLNSVFGISAGAEVTMEANPDDVDERLLAEFQSAGVNRISFGVQSFDSEVLRTLERRHDAARVAEVVSVASGLGLRTSIDLIFGTPGESISSWERTLTIASELPVEHISAYALIIEPGTKLHRQVRSGELLPQDDDEQAEKYWLADQRLSLAGFSWYEVSNFTRGAPSAHNLAYWQSQDWWGYGPGAHSHLAGTRWWNTKHPARYGEALQNGSPVAGIEKLTAEQRNTERVLLGMRLESGVSVSELQKLGVTQSAIDQELELGNLIQVGNRVALSGQSRFLADGIILRLLTAATP